MSSKKIQVALPLLLSIVMIAGMFIGYQLRSRTGNAPLLSTGKQSSIPELIRLIREKYVEEVSSDSIEQLVSKELLRHLDPHSLWMSQSELQTAEEEMNASFQGIGIEFQVWNDSVHVMFVIPDAPADKAGIKIGDILLTLNDSIRLFGSQLTPSAVRKTLLRQTSSMLRLNFFRQGKTIAATLTKGNVPLPAVDAAFMLPNKTGYIHINRFANRTYEEFMQQLEQLQKKGKQQLVIDLRGNGGGLMKEAIDIADEFLPDDKTIVYMEGKHVSRTTFKSSKPGIYEEGPLVVLMDETSASASEVLAGALQDWDRATIIGRRSYGKGLVQQQFNLSSGNAVRLTTARYYTPLGRNIQKPYADKADIDKSDNPHLRFPDLNDETDSSWKTGKVFTTPAGKKLFGGGGIYPDINIAWDTSSLSPAIFEMLYKNTLKRIVHEIYLNNKNYLDSMPNAFRMATFIQPGMAFKNQILKAAAADEIPIKNLSNTQEKFLVQRCGMLLARQRFHQQGFYEVAAGNDPAIQKALDTFNATRVK